MKRKKKSWFEKNINKATENCDYGAGTLTEDWSALVRSVWVWNFYKFLQMVHNFPTKQDFTKIIFYRIWVWTHKTQISLKFGSIVSLPRSPASFWAEFLRCHFHQIEIRSRRLLPKLNVENRKIQGDRQETNCSREWFQRRKRNPGWLSPYWYLKNSVKWTTWLKFNEYGGGWREST